VVGAKSEASTPSAAARGVPPVRVAVHGATGKLGALIVALLKENNEGLEYHDIINFNKLIFFILYFDDM
jgi:hypothetical protein